MPNLGQVLNEIQGMRVENPLDTIRRKYLATMYNGPRELDHGIEKMREHGIMRLLKGRSANHVIQNVHVGIQGEGSH